MQSLVIGASGMVGSEIVKRLVASGEQPWALSRSQQPATANIRWITGDLHYPQQLAAPSVERLFCTVDPGLFLSALPQLATPALKRIVFFTTTSLVTKRDSEIEQERTVLERLACSETDLSAACTARGIAFTALRPTVVYCEGRDVNVSRIARLIQRFGVFPLAGRGQGLRQPVHAEDLAVGAIAASACPAAANKAYDLAGGETLSYREMVGRVFDGLGRPRLIVPIPIVAWRAVYAIARPLLPNTNVAMGLRMAKDMVFDSSAAARDFGWKPRPFRPRF
jgi:nucleoside-diphosphate-sugar epimerase